MEHHQKLLITLLKMMVEAGASDLHLSPNTPPKFRLHGRLQPAIDQVMSDKDTEEIMRFLLTKEQKEEVGSEKGDTDAAATIDGQRFRINVYKTQKGYTIAIRHLPGKIPSIGQLGLPEKTIVELLSRKDGGIILVTGPTGSGKSTTLASMIDRINT